MSEIKYIEIDGQRVPLKKGLGGYRVVNPMFNEDGSFNWFNTITGGWNNLFMITIIIILFISQIYLFNQQSETIVDGYNKLAERCNPLLSEQNKVDYANYQKNLFNLSKFGDG